MARGSLDLHARRRASRLDVLPHGAQLLVLELAPGGRDAGGRFGHADRQSAVAKGEACRSGADGL